MVDTINPQTGSADSFGQDLGGSSSAASQNPGNVFSGFSKPDDVKVNLAAKDAAGSSTFAGSVSASNIDATFSKPTNNAPVADIASTPSTSSDNHISYASSRSSINFKAIAFMFGIGLFSVPESRSERRFKPPETFT